MGTVISRKDLYDRVWRQPIVHLAKEFGLSDVGLRKVCNRHNIPTPPAGYWAKVAHGKKVAATKLPDPAEDRSITIWRGTSGEEPVAVARARADALASVTEAPAASTDAPAVERTIAKLRAAKPNSEGLISSRGGSLISVTVRPESLARAEQLLHELVAAANSAGLVLKPGDGAMVWKCADETVTFDLVEAADQVEHVATEKELSAHANWQRKREDEHRRFGYWSSYGEPKIPKWEQRYNGRLAIRLEKVRIRSEQDPWGSGIRGSFADSRTRDVFRMIRSIVGSIAAIAAAKGNNAEYEKRRRAAEEVARLRWQEEERRRYEWERAGKVLNELIEVEREADRLSRFLTSLQGKGPLPEKTHRLAALAQVRLSQLLVQLSTHSIERRLDASRLFNL